MIKQQLVILISGLLSVIPLSTYSCALHGDYGFERFTGFHPFAQQYNSEQYSPSLLLKHATQTQVQSGEDSAVSITYRVPVNYDKVNVSFSGDQDIEFLESAIVPLHKVSGSYNLRYKVSLPGTYQISIRIDAFDGIRPVSMLQHIEVHSG